MRRGAVLAAGSACIGLAVVACFDVLHGTGDLRTACEVDASVAGCGPAAADDLCAASASDARHSAAHACAWLGACETPMGRNAFGDCMFAALLALDCDANPDHKISGPAAAVWRCLATATSCTAVGACVFPAGVEACSSPGSYTACGTAGPANGPNDRGVRVECGGGGPLAMAHGENCALWGQTCSASPGAAVCAPSASPGCTVDECAGSIIHWCAGDQDVGIDCAAFGSARCGGFPATAPTWVACIPAGAPGVACSPGTLAACSGGVARLCPAGITETVDCAAIFGVPPDASACRPGALDPPFDWTSACELEPPACTSDGCDGGVMTGCAHGAAFSVDCVDAGLGACSMRSTDLGTQQHAACAPP